MTSKITLFKGMIQNILSSEFEYLTNNLKKMTTFNIKYYRDMIEFGLENQFFSVILYKWIIYHVELVTGYAFKSEPRMIDNIRFIAQQIFVILDYYVTELEKINPQMVIWNKFIPPNNNLMTNGIKEEKMEHVRLASLKQKYSKYTNHLIPGEKPRVMPLKKRIMSAELMKPSQYHIIPLKKRPN